MADSVSLDSKNSLTPIYVLGQKGIINQVPAGPQENTFNISYIVDLKREPNYSTSNLIRNLSNDNLYSGVQISVGGITGKQCYLTSYSVVANQNDLVKGNVSYVSFLPLVGNLSYQSGNYYDTLQSFSHAWASYALGTGSTKAFLVYKFDYNMAIEWKPTYIIGKASPVQVNLMNGREEIQFYTDIYTGINFTGNYISEFTKTNRGVELSGLATICPTGINPISGSGYAGSFAFENVPGIFFDFSGYKLVDENLNAQVDSFFENKATIRRYF